VLGNSWTKLFVNALTFLNITFGFIALVYTLNESYKIAALLIIIAAVMDRMDGKMARKLNVASELGKQLDSLCDIVSFGVAPAILIYSQVLVQHNIIGLIVTLVFILCGTFRLARFNVLNIPDYFVGMPITMAGSLLALISLTAISANYTITLIITFLLAVLMISNIKVNKI